MIPEDGAALVTELFGEEFEVHPELGPCLPPDQLRAFAQRLKDMNYTFFVYCAATHFPESKTAEEHLLVAYRVRRLGAGTVTMPFCVRTPCDIAVPTLCGIWAGADWQEREQYDLVGIKFEGHPDLRRIMMPEDWEGFPLRRDYAIDTPHFPWR